MLQLKPLDESVPIFQQLGADVSPVSRSQEEANALHCSKWTSGNDPLCHFSQSLSHCRDIRYHLLCRTNIGASGWRSEPHSYGFEYP